MKKEVNVSFKEQNREGNDCHLEIIGTTNASSNKNAAAKNFSAADLWNIQRQRKNFSVRKNSF